MALVCWRREGMVMTGEKIRESVIAGSWYPGNPQQLTREILQYVREAAAEPVEGELKALIVPHAGYMYSGGVAAYAYKLLQEQSFDRVLVIAPSHRAHFQGSSIYPLGGYRTPLGVVPLDRELVDELLQHADSIRYVPQADAQEHSLEIQLPFLQVMLKDFHLTPIVMGNQSLANCQDLAAAISQACRGRRVLLVASSDLSHFHTYGEAGRLDQIVIDQLQAYDPQGLDEALSRGDCEACGGGPMITVLLAARQLGATKVKILRYANSGDITGDKHSVVGYLSAAVVDNPGGKRGADSSRRKNKVGVDLGLSEEEKAALHAIANNAIRTRLSKAATEDEPPPLPRLQELRGAFVCLKIKGVLRGCIGCLQARGPLYRVVGDMAVQAAFCDPRFAPLSSEELEQIDLEISVLTPFQDIQSPEEIEVGRHGILVHKGSQSGLLLPQVATEYGWDRIQFMEWTCQKAGLPKDAWKDPDTRIQIFSADVF
jgi:AmmeMemoRadiSam system protein B/AmmeMemoRadiSam system protein A